MRGKIIISCSFIAVAFVCLFAFSLRATGGRFLDLKITNVDSGTVDHSVSLSISNMSNRAISFQTDSIRVSCLIDKTWHVNNSIAYSFNEYQLVMPGSCVHIHAHLQDGAKALKFDFPYQKFPWKTTFALKVHDYHILYKIFTRTFDVSDTGYEMATERSDVFSIAQGSKTKR
jgi:hypothetical protein